MTDTMGTERVSWFCQNSCSEMQPAGLANGQQLIPLAALNVKIKPIQRRPLVAQLSGECRCHQNVAVKKCSALH